MTDVIIPTWTEVNCWVALGLVALAVLWFMWTRYWKYD